MLSQLLMLFGFFALVLVSVYWVNRAVSLFDQLISDGQSAWVFLEFTALTLPNVIRLVLPLAAFVGTVYVTNRLSQESELVVMQATGFSPFRLARPVLYFGLVVGLMMAVLVHFLVPASRARLAERQLEISQNTAAKFLVEGTFNHPARGLTFYIRSIDLSGELTDLFLSDKRTAGQRSIYTAKRARLVSDDTGPKLVMFDGMVQTLDSTTARLTVTRFVDFTYDVVAAAGDDGPRRADVDELATAALLFADDATAGTLGLTSARMRFAGHERIAQTLLPASTALIGFATLLLGGFSRFGLWRQIAGAAGFIIVLQLLANAASKAGTNQGAHWAVAYAPALAGLAVAAALLLLAGRGRRPPRPYEPEPA